MRNRDQMRKILENEMKLWSAKPFEQLVADLKEAQNYEVKADSVLYQVEVDLLENTKEYVHVGIAVDDGHFLSSIFPLSDSFIVRKVACLAGSDHNEHQR